jgi:chromosome segregation ATPase
MISRYSRDLPRNPRHKKAGRYPRHKKAGRLVSYYVRRSRNDIFRLGRRTERIMGRLTEQSNRITELETETANLKKDFANLKRRFSVLAKKKLLRKTKEI